MYKHNESENEYISISDCRAEKISFDGSVLSFFFPNGFWITSLYPENISENTVRTDSSKIDFHVTNEDIYDIEVYIFKKNIFGNVIRKNVDPNDFINAVNSGKFSLEFIDKYKSNFSYLYKCCIWSNRKPYHSECEIILTSDKLTYSWNNLLYDHIL